MLEKGRKPYISKNYRDLMHRKTNREVWADVLEKHSEFEKPYLADDNYSEMQHYHPVVPGISPSVGDRFDFPFDVHDPGDAPWHVTFYCGENPCWCEEETKCVNLQCTFPIIGVEFASGCEGLSFEISGAEVCITAGTDPDSTCDVNIVMRVPENNLGLPVGLIGRHHTKSISECDDCCIDDSAMAWDSDASASTIAQSGARIVAITGNNGPFSWTVSGSGFSLDDAITTGLTNALNASASACGAVKITVTGCDGTVVTGYVRCTTGQWIEDFELEAFQPPAYDGTPMCTDLAECSPGWGLNCDYVSIGGGPTLYFDPIHGVDGLRGGEIGEGGCVCYDLSGLTHTYSDGYEVEDVKLYIPDEQYWGWTKGCLECVNVDCSALLWTC